MLPRSCILSRVVETDDDNHVPSKPLGSLLHCLNASWWLCVLPTSFLPFLSYPFQPLTVAMAWDHASPPIAQGPAPARLSTMDTSCNS